MKWSHKIVVIAFLFAITSRILLFPHPFSGFATVNPRKGDFEAQRHWKELTYSFGVFKNSVSTSIKYKLKGEPIESAEPSESIGSTELEMEIDLSSHPSPRKQMMQDVKCTPHDCENRPGIWNWYRYDLEYWGLDYPPLSAYHSYIMGIIASWIYPEMVEFERSRGIDTWQTILFMRLSVLLIDCTVYLPVVYLLAMKLWKIWRMEVHVQVTSPLGSNLVQGKAIDSSKSDQVNTPQASNHSRSNTFLLCSKSQANLFALLLPMIHPALLLIDNGHFQYNNFSIGLTLWSVYFCLKRRILLASIFFVFALNYKIMALYYSLPIFFFILSHCFMHRNIFQGALRVSIVGLIVISTLLLCWSPFLPNGEWKQVLKRIFPFERGIFEDYVASFWCTIHPLLNFIKRRYFYGESIPFLPIISGVLTLLTSLPSNFLLFHHPSAGQFIYSLTVTSLSFFLCSFHVHEKTILFPAIVASFSVFFGRRLTITNTIVFTYLATYSLYPLMIKDTLQIAYCAILIIFSLFYLWPLYASIHSTFVRVALFLGFVGSLMLQALISFIPPPEKLPYLYIYFHSTYSFVGISICWIIYMWEQWSLYRVQCNMSHNNIINPTGEHHQKYD